MATYSATSLVIEKSSARSGPGGAEPLGESPVGERSGEGAGQRRGVVRLDEQGVDSVGGDVAVAVEGTGDDRRLGRHRLDQHDAERLPMQRRRAEHGGAAQPAELLRVVDPSEPGDPGVAGEASAEGCPVGTVAPDPQPGVGGQLGERLEEHGEPLALLVTAAEEDRRTGRLHRRRGGDGRDVDAVEEHPDPVCVLREVRGDELLGVLGDDDLDVDAAQQAIEHRLEHSIARRHTGGVEGADDRRAAHHQGGHRWPRGERFVDVEHVELLVAEGTHRSQSGGGVGRQRGDRSVGRRRQAVAERGDEWFRRRAIARSEHPRLVALAAQLACEPEDLRLDATGHAEAVGGDDPDPQRPPQLHGSGP